MARLLGPDFISLQVRDLATSRAFYTDVLGFSIDPRFNNPDFVLFATNSIPFALAEAKAGLNDGLQRGVGLTLWIDCDAVDELHAKMAAAGATIIKEPFDSPFGRAFIFTDPDEYRITVNENPWERFPLGGSSRV